MNYGHLVYVLPAAIVLDLVLGDPRKFPHPVRWMGRAASALESDFRKIPLKPVITGGLFALFLIVSTWILSYVTVFIGGMVHPAVQTVVEILMVYYCISARSLEKEAMAVSDALTRKNLGKAREKVSMIVGRDAARLDEAGVARAAVETVAENLVDGVIAPLFFALIGGAPLAMTYKMVNTLDSMIGYKNDAYIDFGKLAARIDDVFNFIPARLSIPVIALAAQIIARKGKSAFHTARRDGARHTSPNAGHSEAAFAGALEVRLGGPSYYHGRRVEKPWIGEMFKNVRPRHIRRACDLMLLSSLLWGAFLWLVSFGFI